MKKLEDRSFLFLFLVGSFFIALFIAGMVIATYATM